MKKIAFKRIYLSYFLSTGERVEHEYNEGITFIRGENKSKGQEEQNNGVGKTAIFLDGLVYALYGETSRKLKVAKIPFNKGGKKKCIVKLDLEVSEGDDVKKVTIQRSINPSKFILTVDGEDVSQSNASSTQEYLIDEILSGIKKDVFQHSIAMKIDATTPFMSMKSVERDKFIGGVFDLSYLKEAEKIARENYNDISKDVGKQEVGVNGYASQITTLKNQIKFITDQNEEKKKKRLRDIEEIKENIDNFEIGDKPEALDFDKQNEIIDESLKKLRDVKDGLRKDLDKEREKRIAEEREELDRKSKILKLKAEIEADVASLKCSKCGRDFDEESKAKIMESVEEKKELVRELIK